MSFPGSGLETTYRNNLREVAKMLQTNHQDKYMVRGGTHLGYEWGSGVQWHSWLARQLGKQGISHICLPWELTFGFSGQTRLGWRLHKLDPLV